VSIENLNFSAATGAMKNPFVKTSIDASIGFTKEAIKRT